MASNPDQFRNYSRIISDLKDGKLAPIYFAMGSDYYLYQQFIAALKLAFKSRFGDNADLVQRWGTDLKAVTDITAVLGGGGLFSTASLVMLHEIQDSGTTVKTNLSSLLGKLPPDTIILAHYSISDFRRAKWLDAMQNIAQVVPLSSPSTTVMPGIVGQIAAGHKLKLDDEAIYRLIELSSGELAIIDNELEKLSLYITNPDETIKRNIVDQVAGSVENAQVAQFIEAVSNRDRKHAIQTLVEIHHQGKEGLPFVVAMLYNRLIQLMALNEPLEARKSIGQGTTSYFFLKQLEPVARNYQLAELQKATRRLAELDLQFRLGSVDMLSAFSKWVSEVV